MKIIINSEMRVGSRWLHYLLVDLYKMKASPEIDVERLKSGNHEIRKYLDNNRIAKIHHASTDEVFQYVKPVDYVLITVVRNPRDRIVSKAFHHLAHDPRIKSELEAIDHYVYSDYTREASSRQQAQMMWGYSTREHIYQALPYIWTTYEWMLENIVREVMLIDNYLGEKTALNKIMKVCKEHEFKAKSGRPQGKEKRKDTWRRKGIIGDWLNWFDVPMLKHTLNMQFVYWQKLLENKGKEDV